LDFSNSKPEKLRPEKFQSKNFYIFQLSRHKFSGKKFHGQKKYGFPYSITCIPETDLRRWCQSVAKLTPFFPTFAPDFFSFFNFQPENFPVFQISNRIKSGAKTFAAKKIVYTNFRAENFWP